MKTEQRFNEVERAIVGSALIFPQVLDEIELAASDFANEYLARIWSAMLAMHDAESKIDFVTVGQEIDGDDQELLMFLGRLAKDTPTAANAQHYAKLVKEFSIERVTNAAVLQAQKDLMRRDLPIRERVDLIQSRFTNLISSDAKESQSIRDILPRVVDSLDARFTAGGKLIGLSTGLGDLDDLLGGIRAPDLIILAARPSMGKTALAMQIATHAAMTGENVMVFSLEMSAEQLTERQLSAASNVFYSKIMSGNLSDGDWPHITYGMSVLRDIPMTIDDSAGITISELRNRARRAHKRGKLGLIVVDYLQLVSAGGENRTGEISQVSLGLKRLAKELNTPVLALSQLNRELERRPNKRPIMADIRESGQIEQDADKILFIYRDEIYNKDSPEKGTAEIIAGKQRAGATGMRRVSTRLDVCKFENWDGVEIEAKPIPDFKPNTFKERLRYGDN